MEESSLYVTTLPKLIAVVINPSRIRLAPLNAYGKNVPQAPLIDLETLQHCLFKKINKIRIFHKTMGVT